MDSCQLVDIKAFNANIQHGSAEIQRCWATRLELSTTSRMAPVTSNQP